MLYILEYIWLDGSHNCRSKTKVVDLNIDEDKGISLLDIPEWNYDGSSTGQATTELSEVILKPVRLYKDVFRYSDNAFFVLCENYNVDGTPHVGNMRHYANEIFNKGLQEEPMFGLEQEFFICKKLKKRIKFKDSILSNMNTSNLSSLPNTYVDLVEDNMNVPKGQHYCGIGGNNIIERSLMDNVLNKLIYCGINVTGMNAEVAPSQWEFQVCSVGIKASDDLIMLRYICNRFLESEELFMELHPKLDFIIKQGENGSGCHINFSTKTMRQDGGFNEIQKAIDNLSKNHELHIKHYGEGNELRLTGKHETSDIKTFSVGVGSRNTSIRIPFETKKNNKGYFEDRRPSSNLNPYVSTSLLFATSVGIEQTYFV